MIAIVVTGAVAALSGGLIAAVNRRLWRGYMPCDHATPSAATTGPGPTASARTPSPQR